MSSISPKNQYLKPDSYVVKAVRPLCDQQAKSPYIVPKNLTLLSGRTASKILVQYCNSNGSEHTEFIRPESRNSNHLSVLQFPIFPSSPPCCPSPAVAIFRKIVNYTVFSVVHLGKLLPLITMILSSSR